MVVALARRAPKRLAVQAHVDANLLRQIVHRPAEAVADFLRSGLDVLFLGHLLATKTR